MYDFIKDKQDYQYFVLEPMIDIKEEQYLMLRREDDDIYCIYCDKGGMDQVNPEENGVIFPVSNKSQYDLGALDNLYFSLLKLFERTYGNFMEVNPVIITRNNKIIPADFAFEVDSTSFHQWNQRDHKVLRMNSISNKNIFDVEKKIKSLSNLVVALVKKKLKRWKMMLKFMLKKIKN